VSNSWRKRWLNSRPLWTVVIWRWGGPVNLLTVKVNQFVIQPRHVVSAAIRYVGIAVEQLQMTTLKLLNNTVAMIWNLWWGENFAASKYVMLA
jgi:hypothetical protein